MIISNYHYEGIYHRHFFHCSRTPLADFWKLSDSGSVVWTFMDLDQPRGVWVVVGSDKIIRVNKYMCI